METEQNETPSKTNFQNTSELQQYKLKYDALLLESEQEFHDPNILDFYVMSKIFLREWNEFIGYESGKPNFSQHPADFNIDLLESLSETKKYRKLPSQIILRKGLQNKIDYEIINKKMMEFFEHDFTGVKILRTSYLQSDGHKFVEVYSKELSTVLITHTYLMEIDRGHKHELAIEKIQCSSQVTIKELKDHILKMTSKNNYGPENIRLWKLTMEFDKFLKEMKRICNDTKSFDYEISIKGIFLEKNLEVKLEDFGFSDDDIIIIELRESQENWSFVQEGIPTMKKCGFCSKFIQNILFCSCKKTGYCSKECKFKDKRYHKRYCDSTDLSDDEDDDEFQKNQHSRMGLTGLQNLGNTCFMNSALQCLSNTFQLTKFFLEKRYLADINSTNILGSKGKLAKEYSNLLINLWFNTSDTFSPYLIKSRVSDINQMFSGYNQHDSQEFLLYLLDGLHEDLNKIKNKPYLPDLDFPQDTPDHIMAKESWKAYQKRNLSIITDLMMGQYKSVITCPEEGCNKVSTTFDPYLTWSVPISSKKRKFIDFKFLPFELGRIPYIIKLEITSEILSVTQLKALAEAKIGVTSQTCQFYYISRSIEKVQEDKITIKELRKKVKRSSYYELFLIEKSREETLILPEDSIEIYASFTHEEETSWSSAYKRTFFVRPFYFSQKDSAHSIHLKIFKYLRYFFENSDKNIELEEENSIKNLDEEAYKVVNADNACYLISWSPNYRGFDPCEFCGNKYCQGCKVEDDERINLQELLEKCKSSSCTSVNNIEIEIFWKPKKTFVTSLSKFMNNYQPFVKKSGLEMEDHKDEMEEEGLSLYDCMKLFSEPEQLDKENQWYCSNCKEHKLAKKQMSVYKAPKYLIIHLKRFKSKGSRSFYSYGNHGKANDLVKFPIKGLRLNDYVINHDKMEDYDNENNNEKNKPPVVYDLYAVSNHSGGLGGGHYYAYGKNAIKDSWYCFNDSSVREMNESEVITSGAYCLFYERRDSNQKKNIEFDIVKIKKEDKVKNSEKNEEKKENLIGSACRDDEYNISEAAPRKEILERINHNAS